MTLTDLSPVMLDLSRTINTECEHIQGDMRSLGLGRVFDAIFVEDAVMYLTSESDLQATLETAYIHCRPGGVVLVMPDYVRETFAPYTNHGGHDGQVTDFTVGHADPARHQRRRPGPLHQVQGTDQDE